LLVSKQADVQTPSALHVSALNARERERERETVDRHMDYLTDYIYIDVDIHICLDSCTQS